MAEAEWRIAGAHVFFGKKRNTGDRIALPLDQIDAVLVQNPEDIANFTAILVDMAAVQSAAEVPPVLRQPESLKLLGEVYRGADNGPVYDFAAKGGCSIEVFEVMSMTLLCIEPR
ncbi:hypothetical protein [Aquabacterium sp.]|uniref:hypothetical protein n=1 Tax=Aquabacterium sp. TaxID=1872578 RepID=UPI0025BA8201|nr:hypothetical protein [Aquabacterium sp.]